MTIANNCNFKTSCLSGHNLNDQIIVSTKICENSNFDPSRCTEYRPNKILKFSRGAHHAS